MDAIAPTKERIRHHPGGIESPRKGRDADRKFYRLKGLPETLYDQDKLTDNQIEAWRIFEPAYLTANREPPSIGAYGERRGGAESDYLTIKIQACLLYTSPSPRD